MLTRDRRLADELIAIGVAAVTTAALALRGAQGPAQGPGVTVTLVAAMAFAALLIPAVQVEVRGWFSTWPWLRHGVPAAFAAYGAGSLLLLGSPAWYNVLAWPVCIGLAVLAIGRRTDGELPPVRFLGAGVALWVLAGIWDRAVQIRVPGDARLGLAYLSCVALALFLFAVAYPRRSFDVRLGLTGRELGTALLAVVAVAGAAIPLGALLGFLHWEPRWQGALHAAARIFGLIVFVGLPEEFLFRGVYQEALSRLWTPRAGWVAASVLFGAVHVVKGMPPPNWGYAMLATVAGLGYGWVYLRTGKLAAAAVTHGLVNWIWSTWLGS